MEDCIVGTLSKTIYYCWFGGSKPQNVLDCINNWKEKLPAYQIIEINEHNKELFDVEKECQNNLCKTKCGLMLQTMPA